jgi:hypothetical protein
MSIDDDPHVPHPLDITFDSEDRFSFYDNTHRVPYVINTASQTGTLLPIPLPVARKNG